MIAEEFFEKIAANIGDFFILILVWILCAVLWTLPFVVMFLPLYFEDAVSYIKSKINK
tara:strand:- start:2049 stop:2222 length:174 start_codon:yes stop_codon:yes gene_type:complete